MKSQLPPAYASGMLQFLCLAKPGKSRTLHPPAPAGGFELGNCKSYILITLTVILLIAGLTFYQFFLGSRYPHLLLRSYITGTRLTKDDLDPWSFQIIDSGNASSVFKIAKDKNTLWINAGGDIGFVTLKGVDTKTFEFMEDTGNGYCLECYAQDKNHIYYIMVTMHEKWLDSYPNVTFPSREQIYKNNAFVLPNADKASFTVLGDNYAKDKMHTYYRGVVVK